MQHWDSSLERYERSRIPLFMAVDPLTENYVFLTPYFLWLIGLGCKFYFNIKEQLVPSTLQPKQTEEKQPKWHESREQESDEGKPSSKQPLEHLHGIGDTEFQEVVSSWGGQTEEILQVLAQGKINCCRSSKKDIEEWVGHCLKKWKRLDSDVIEERSLGIGHR